MLRTIPALIGTRQRPRHGGVAALLLAATTAASAHADVDSALELVPRDAIGAFIVPSLKRCSDELAACLERVDRAEALLVGRPIDLVKARLGVIGGVRDDGALIGVLRPAAATADSGKASDGRGAGSPGSIAPVRTILVPVTDAEVFLASNFDRERVPGMFRRPDGTLLHAAVVNRGDRRWVALSDSASGIAGLRPDPEAATAHRARLGDSAPRILEGTDVIAWVTGAALESELDAARGVANGLRNQAETTGARESITGRERFVSELAGSDQGGVDEAAAAGLSRSIASSVTIAAFAWDIDALGLLGRGVVRVDPASELGAALAGGSAPAARSLLDRLPAAPPYWAIGVDLDGLGGTDALDALTTMLGVPPEDRATIRRWISGASQLQFGVYPSRLGVAVGGVLNDSALVLVTDDPVALGAKFIEGLAALDGERPGLRRELLLERGRVLKDAGSADAFELKETVRSGSDGEARDAQVLAIWSIARSVLFGARGVHGLTGKVDDAVVMTFSQRPDVWRRAIEAARARGADGRAPGTSGNDRLGDGDAIIAMREFGLATVDIEGVLGMAQLARVAKQVAAMIPGGGEIPSLDFGVEPIYAAVDVDGHEVHGAVVIPSGVVGVLIDLARRSQLGR